MLSNTIKFIIYITFLLSCAMNVISVYSKSTHIHICLYVHLTAIKMLQHFISSLTVFKLIKHFTDVLINIFK